MPSNDTTVTSPCYSHPGAPRSSSHSLEIWSHCLQTQHNLCEHQKWPSNTLVSLFLDLLCSEVLVLYPTSATQSSTKSSLNSAYILESPGKLKRKLMSNPQCKHILKHTSHSNVQSGMRIMVPYLNINTNCICSITRISNTSLPNHYSIFSTSQTGYLFSAGTPSHGLDHHLTVHVKSSCLSFLTLVPTVHQWTHSLTYIFNCRGPLSPSLCIHLAKPTLWLNTPLCLFHTWNKVS